MVVKEDHLDKATMTEAVHARESDQSQDTEAVDKPVDMARSCHLARCMGQDLEEHWN